MSELNADCLFCGICEKTFLGVPISLEIKSYINLDKASIEDVVEAIKYNQFDMQRGQFIGIPAFQEAIKKYSNYDELMFEMEKLYIDYFNNFVVPDLSNGYVISRRNRKFYRNRCRKLFSKIIKKEFSEVGKIYAVMKGIKI